MVGTTRIVINKTQGAADGIVINDTQNTEYGILYRIWYSVQNTQLLTVRNKTSDIAVLHNDTTPYMFLRPNPSSTHFHLDNNIKLDNPNMAHRCTTSQAGEVR